jgi:single-strand DNA-binding protein
MNIVVLHGVLSSAPVTRTLASGSVVVSLELSTMVEGGTASVPVAWFDPPGEVAWAPGTALTVAGSVRRRFFRSGGLTQSRTEVVAAEVVEAGKRRQAQRLVERAAARLGGPESGAVRST